MKVRFHSVWGAFGPGDVADLSEEEYKKAFLKATPIEKASPGKASARDEPKGGSGPK